MDRVRDKKTEFLLKEYEIIAVRLSSSDSYSGAFVSIYLVMQTALLTGLGLSLQKDSKVALINQALFNLSPFAVVGIVTTLWAFSVTFTYFHRIALLDKRMILIEERFLEDETAPGYVSIFSRSKWSKPLRSFLALVTFAVLILFLGTWILVGLRL